MTAAAVLPRAWQAQSLLIGYPDEHVLSRAGVLADVAASLPGPAGGPLLRFVEHLRATPPMRLAADYVATFDHRKRCCLYLTYYAHGDTRNRGMALLHLKQTYGAAGLVLGDDELPDHLAVVLEYAAIEPEPGGALLAEHRAGIELLRLALHDAGSPWELVLDSLSATLPPLVGDQRTAVARLAAQGPPAEQVGLAPFGPASSGPASSGPAPSGPASSGPASSGPASLGPASLGPASFGSPTPEGAAR